MVPPEISTSIEQLTPEVDAEHLRGLLVEVRRHLHAHPETGFNEHETQRFLRQILEAYDLTVQGPIAETGLYVDIEGVEPGPTVAYRADMDALAASDQKNVPYASTRPGIAHLCGHDVHMSIAIGTALMLSARENHFRGRVRIFFQPNEEGTPSGAPRMISEGVMDEVDRVFALHVDPTLRVGQIGLKSGAVTAAIDSFEIDIRTEQTGHSARPHNHKDPVWVATQIANTLYQLATRLQDTRNPAVITVCKFRGGDALNVIPDHVELGGTLRTIDSDDRVLLIKQLKETVRHFSELYDIEADTHIHRGSPGVINNKNLINDVRRVVERLYGPPAVSEIDRPSMGAEDFAHYLEHAPGALLRLGSSKGSETNFPLHNSKFDVSEDVLPLGVQFMTYLLLDQLNADEPSLVS